MEHKQLVEQLKAAGDYVDLVVKPAKGRPVFMEQIKAMPNPERVAKVRRGGTGTAAMEKQFLSAHPPGATGGGR